MSVSEPVIQSILLGDAVEHAPVAILVADDEMRFAAANQYACELLGYTREELLEKRVTDIARDPGAPEAFRQMVASGELSGSTTVVRKNGSKLRMRHRSSETRIAGLVYYVSVSWPEEG